MFGEKLFGLFKNLIFRAYALPHCLLTIAQVVRLVQAYLKKKPNTCFNNSNSWLTIRRESHSIPAMYKSLFILFSGLSLSTYAAIPMEQEILRQLDQIRTIGEESWSQRIEQERDRKEEQVELEVPERKVVVSSPRSAR